MKRVYIYITVITVLIAITSVISYVYIKNSKIDSPSNNETQEILKDQIVTFKNFTYTIPGDYQYQYATDNENMIVFFGKDSVWDAYVELFAAPNSLIEKPNTIHDSLTNSGYVISEVKQENILGKDFLLTDYFNKNVPAKIAYTSAAENLLYEITIYDNVHNTFDRSYLNELINILVNAKYNG